LTKLEKKDGVMVGWAMSWFRRKRPPNLFFMFYAALAMVGAFSFAATESLRSISFEIQTQAPDRIFSSPQDYFIESAAEEPAPAAAKGNAFRGGFQRFVFPGASSNYGADDPGSSFVTISKTRFFDVKKIILLKLRI
jgi:hypothetical protein